MNTPRDKNGGDAGDAIFSPDGTKLLSFWGLDRKDDGVGPRFILGSLGQREDSRSIVTGHHFIPWS